MDTNKIRDISREQFEARYPVPEGACWNAEQSRYVLFHLKLCTVAKYERFVENWVCWQASRNSVLVELQAEIDGYVRERREAIEAQGLKVAP
ncbi:hypothetical protein [Pseudomonas putida]|uniref:hypothetical protein n=1 Tax=Pseudomonas putida TaxID=303 RepID=UPI001E4EB45F|nr:hypothetical protein [Pseudomonas putida]MCE0972834.1 hypothetical protein [Pseudomonas putida]MDD2119573.1 hypothetical protein [Pseudomonas putida]UPU90468.1 hypothetical protein M0766_16210 [Pseudomonas putida]HDS1729128.1 hypothetical protein [Pseudomonas putida]